MANRVKVAISRSIIVLREQGLSYRQIADALHVDRETVARYVHLDKAKSNPASNLSTGSDAETGSNPAEVTAGDEAAGAPNPASNLSTGSDADEGANPATNLSTGKSGLRSLCEPFRDLIEKKRRQGLTAQRIWQDLVKEKGFEGRYASVKRFVRRLEKSSGLPFRRMESPPGQEAQIDFGPGGSGHASQRQAQTLPGAARGPELFAQGLQRGPAPPGHGGLHPGAGKRIPRLRRGATHV